MFSEILWTFVDLFVIFVDLRSWVKPPLWFLQHFQQFAVIALATVFVECAAVWIAALVDRIGEREMPLVRSKLIRRISIFIIHINKTPFSAFVICQWFFYVLNSSLSVCTCRQSSFVWFWLERAPSARNFFSVYFVWHMKYVPCLPSSSHKAKTIQIIRRNMKI